MDGAERQALPDTITRFARSEIAPNVDAWEAPGESPLQLYRRAADLGLLGSERICREVKVMVIGGGAEEMMKNLAVRQMGL